MRVKLFTLRYSATLGGFDDPALLRYAADKELLEFREHFFTVSDVPHLACVLLSSDALIDAAELAAVQEQGARAAGHERETVSAADWAAPAETTRPRRPQPREPWPQLQQHARQP